MLQTKYLVFKIVEEKPKTYVYGVYSKTQGSLLGVIKWFSHWRQYCFFPETNTVFNCVCLFDIIKFIDVYAKKVGD